MMMFRLDRLDELETFLVFHLPGKLYPLDLLFYMLKTCALLFLQL